MHYRLCAIHFIGSATGNIKLRSIFPGGDDRGAPCHFTAYQILARANTGTGAWFGSFTSILPQAGPTQANHTLRRYPMPG